MAAPSISSAQCSRNCRAFDANRPSSSPSVLDGSGPARKPEGTDDPRLSP
jgi:hypothetical protein